MARNRNTRFCKEDYSGRTNFLSKSKTVVSQLDLVARWPLPTVSGVNHSPVCGAVLLALFCCLFTGPLMAQPRHYQEAHVYISGPSAPSAINTLAVENPRPMLLTDHGFQTFEPLEQPDEHVPAIIIDEQKTFQTIIGFGAAFTDAASTTFGRLPKDSQEEFLTACVDPEKGNGYTLPDPTPAPSSTRTPHHRQTLV